VTNLSEVVKTGLGFVDDTYVMYVLGKLLSLYCVVKQSFIQVLFHH